MSLSSIDAQIRNHALLCSSAFLVVLPLGVLIARYARNLTDRWWGIHLTFQLFFAGPLIYTGIYFGLDVVKKLGAGNFNDTHKKIGLSLLILYTAQLSIGLFIHFVKMKSLFRGRPPQNYFHAILGLAILALAAYQVHYGYSREWSWHPVPRSAKNAWLALIIVFWSLYALGLVFLPRQYRKERNDARSGTSEKDQDTGT